MQNRTPSLAGAERLYGSFALLGSVLCWATVPVLLRHLTSSIDAWTANGLRYPLAALFYWPILWHAHRTGHLNRATAMRCLVPALLAWAGQVFWALAPYYLAASAIGFFVRFALVWSVLAAVTLFPDERRLLTVPRFYVGLTLCVSGFVTMSISAGISSAPLSLVGVVIMLLCSLFFGLYAVSVRYFLRDVHPLFGFGVVSHYVSAGTVAGMCLLGRVHDLADLSRQSWALLILSSVLGITLGHFFLYTALQRVGAAITSGFQSITPFLTVALASVFLGESMTALQWTSGLMLAGGAVILLTAQHVIHPGAD